MLDLPAKMALLADTPSFEPILAEWSIPASQISPYLSGRIGLPMTLTSAALLLFLVMDPLGNIAFFLPALRPVAPERRKKVILRELLIALGVMVLFLFSGKYVLQLLHVSEPGLTLSGGIILLLIALRMIFPDHSNSMEEKVDTEPFIVPLAIPYVAGPSALATELLLMSREPNRWPEWLLALFLAWLVSGVIIYFSTNFEKVLGEKGLIAIERLMGMILVTVSVEMVMKGVTTFMQAG